MLAAIICLLVPLFIAEFETVHDIVNNQSICPFKLLSGLPCPGCGITKSLVFIYKGDWLQSIHYHLFGPIVFLFCLGLIPLLIVELIQKQNYFNNLFFNRRLGMFMAGVLGFYHLIRLIVFLSSHSVSQILFESIWA